jgi:hypothetical protein
MITLKVHSSLQAFGMLAAVSARLAAAEARHAWWNINAKNTMVSCSFIGRMHRRLAVLFLDHSIEFGCKTADERSFRSAIARPANPRRPATEEMITMEPRPAHRMAGT